LTGLAFAASLATTAALAGALAANGDGNPASTAASTCRKAEVNPVTGHVLCIDPLGAPVEAPPTSFRADPMRTRGTAPGLGAALQVLYGV